MRRVGIFGGTFNPVHIGHVRLACGFIERLNLDLLLVIPASIPPHKSQEGLISGEHRLRMCELAFANVSGCRVYDMELRRGEKSYTVDTLEALHAGECRDAQLYLIMGSDMFFTMTQWKDWRRIFELAVLCVAEREPALLERLGDYARRLEQLGARCKIIEAPALVLSSTELRRRIHLGMPVDDAVPYAVVQYIKKHRLYITAEN